ncbi:hypothetical protein [Geodermatophilus obscurus]|uniref:hypothetical protein n=1 Tax=Geodermatophilus obscurus TaxID=1861 RepID=UPI001FCCAE3A|nr:hypothetical protein [Geodermatophilus obscurus]
MSGPTDDLRGPSPSSAASPAEQPAASARWTTCARPPVSRAAATSRPIAVSSAAGGREARKAG